MTFTYYLKDSFKTAKDKRVAADKKLAEDGKDVRFPAWDVLEQELREEGPAVFVTIKDSSGAVVRHVEAANKKGVQRVTWDLHHTLKEAITNEPRPSWMGIARGVMALPGTYTATLNVRHDGEIRELATPVSFQVEEAIMPTLRNGTAQSAQAFQQKVVKVEAAVTAASLTVSDLQEQVAAYRTALDRTSDRAALEKQYTAIRAELFSLDEALNGKVADDRMGAEPATISSRVGFAKDSSSSHYGPTPQSHEQLGYALEAFADVRQRLAVLKGETIPAFEKALLDAGAPWVRGASVLPELD